MSDHSELKNRLSEYLSLKGIDYDRKAKTYRCPFHADEHPSATLYQNIDGHVLTCHVCSKSYDIFNICGQLENLNTFPEQVESVKRTLGIIEVKEKYVSLTLEDAKQIYTRENIERISKNTSWGEIKQTWKYYDKSGKIVALDVRFWDPFKGKKSVLTFWYNGKSIQTKDYPVIIYGLDRLTDKPVLIHEGAKCADIGHENLKQFDNISWNGGSGKAHLAAWKSLKNKEGFILYDDDQKTYPKNHVKAGQLFPPDEQPGLKAALKIQAQLPHFKIIKHVQKARDIKPDGADIEEILQVMTPDELTLYILNPDNHLKVSDITVSSNKNHDEKTHAAENPSGNSDKTDDTGFSEPFRILGLCEGEGHFIDEIGFYQHYKLDSLGKGKLLNLANLNYWKGEFPAGRNGVAWDESQDYVVTASKLKEFDTKKLKGRGAWRSGTKICYNDGAKLYGEPEPEFIYLKDSRVNIGLDSKPASRELLARIRDIMFDLSFETKTDAVRTMGWTALAPFCGALEYRPTLLMTGESGYGKTKVQTLFIQKITDFIHADMRTSSEAGIRRKISKDSKAVFFDEGGKENDKMKLNFDTILSFIRSNYSDDSPDGFKANMNSDGYVTYKMSSMFGLATTDPTIENVQDENRILRVHFIKPKHTSDQWQAIENELIEILNKENCDAIRSLIWSRLKTITCLTKRLVQLARNKTNRDYRSSYADMLLASAYMVVWCDTPEPTEEQINDLLDKYYMYQPVAENRSEVEEYISRIMDEVIEILNDGHREKVTILEALNRINDGKILNDEGQFETFIGARRSAHIRTLQQYGIKLHSKGVHFANDNHMIKKITGLGKGYEKLLARHKGYVRHDDPVTYSGGGSKRGTIIKGLLDKSDQEKLEGVF